VSRRHLAPAAPAYPSRLLGMSPPPRIDVSGDVGSGDRRVIAIVGTRAATKEALSHAQALAASLAQAGVIVVSGGALGIDAAAHEGALAAGGATWVVAPTGSHHVYPEEHGDLFERVESSAHGCMIWPFEADKEVTLAGFHQRNAVIAALCDAMVVVQAGDGSGALSAARSARRYGRPVYAVGAPPWAEAGFEGGNDLLRRGEATLLVGARGLAQLLGLLEAPPVQKSAPKTRLRAKALPLPGVTLEPSTKPVHPLLLVMSRTPRHAEQIAESAGISLPRTLSELLTLSLGDVVVEGPPGFFRRTNNS